MALRSIAPREKDMAERRLLIAGNWKMNTVLEEARALARGVAEAAAAHPGVDVAVIPPTCLLGPVAEVLEGGPVALGAQNIHPAESGAFTGETAGAMLSSLGATYALCGHSERRKIFGESSGWIGEKVRATHRAGLTPILCVGETLAEREAGNTEAVVAEQLDAGLEGLSNDKIAGTVIAYEPVWAIGTGKTATPDQAQAVHAFIRGRLAERADAATAAQVRIQYGGSVKPGNAAELLGQPDIDGALVGGASLKADSFAAIIAAG